MKRMEASRDNVYFKIILLKTKFRAEKTDSKMKYIITEVLYI